MVILGIESSCDETAAGIVTDQGDILANVLRTQQEEHERYGGVVPEIAARRHLDCLEMIIQGALKQAGLGFSDLDGIAATAGPGLIGGVMTGLMVGKTLAAIHNLPFLAVNHLVGHALTPRLTDKVPFPYLALLASGGHCQIFVVQGSDRFSLLGTTLDDAAGEAFDKVGRLLELPYPGGPHIERLAAKGQANRFAFPRPLLGRTKNGAPYDFSFSGLKTAVLRAVKSLPILSETDKADLSASFQAAVGDVLENRVKNGLDYCQKEGLPIQHLVITGGVAANGYLRDRLQTLADSYGYAFVAPPRDLCTDNGAMIAWAGIEKLQKGQTDALDVAPRARWPLQ